MFFFPRQKQQIMQLHARIRENELRAQQVLQNQRGRCDDSYVLKTKVLHYACKYDELLIRDGVKMLLKMLRPGVPLQESSLDSPALSRHSPQTPLCCENGELAHRLASAELEVIHLKEFLKQNTQKYTEDIKKLEEKVCWGLDVSHKFMHRGVLLLETNPRQGGVRHPNVEYFPIKSRPKVFYSSHATRNFTSMMIFNLSAMGYC